jgi:hypothetical protein
VKRIDVGWVERSETQQQHDLRRNRVFHPKYFVPTLNLGEKNRFLWSIQLVKSRQKWWVWGIFSGAISDEFLRPPTHPTISEIETKMVGLGDFFRCNFRRIFAPPNPPYNW